MASFEAPGLRWVSLLQAMAVDGVIARLSSLHRQYADPRRRRWALAGVLFFSAVSLVFNFGYYSDQGVQLIEAWAMAALFPTGVALLSYLKGQKTWMSRQILDIRPMSRTVLDGVLNHSMNDGRRCWTHWLRILCCPIGNWEQCLVCLSLRQESW